MSGFPAAHCRVVACETSGDDAYVLLDTGSPGRPYLYGETCYRKDGQWSGGASGNGPGWSPSSDDPDVGALTFWGDAPASVDMIRVEFDGELVETPVRDGIYFLIKWRVPCPSSMDWPRIVAVRDSGEWKPETTMSLFHRWRAEIK